MRFLLTVLLLTGCATQPEHPAILRPGLHYVTVTGTSMVPVAWPGDRVLITPTPYADLKPGMIVLRYDHSTDPHLVLHALSRKVGDNWYTTGINEKTNRREDAHMLTPDNYRGTKLAIIQPGDLSYGSKP